MAKKKTKKARYGDETYDSKTKKAIRKGQIESYSDTYLHGYIEIAKEHADMNDGTREEFNLLEAEAKRRANGGKIKEYDPDKYLDNGEKNLRDDSFWKGFWKAKKSKK